jgi:hypothetical protein
MYILCIIICMCLCISFIRNEKAKAALPQCSSFRCRVNMLIELSKKKTFQRLNLYCKFILHRRHSSQSKQCKNNPKNDIQLRSTLWFNMQCQLFLQRTVRSGQGSIQRVYINFFGSIIVNKSPHSNRTGPEQDSSFHCDTLYSVLVS